MSSILRRLFCLALIATALATVERVGRAAHLFPGVIATIPVGIDFPLGLAIDHDANRIYVAGDACCSQPGGAVSVVDASTNAEIAVIPVAEGVFYLALNPVTRRLYVTHGFGGNIVSVIDTVTNTVLTTIAVGRVPAGVAVNPVTNRVYVANNHGRFVSVIDGASNTVVGTITPPLSPLSVTVDPRTNRFYVTYGTNVAIIDGATDTIVATISDNSSTLAFGIGLDPLTNRLYVPRFSGPLGGTVAVMDIAAQAVVASIPVGGNPNGVGVNPATSRVYVGVRSANRVAVIDGATDRVIRAIGSIRAVRPG